MTKWAINLYSKHTGKLTMLGSLYATYEQAQEAVKIDVCTRCNRFEIVPTSDDIRDRLRQMYGPDKIQGR